MNHFYNLINGPSWAGFDEPDPFKAHLIFCKARHNPLHLYWSPSRPIFGPLHRSNGGLQFTYTCVVLDSRLFVFSLTIECLLDRIPAVGFPGLVNGEHVPALSIQSSSSTRKRGDKKTKTGKRSTKQKGGKGH